MAAAGSRLAQLPKGLKLTKAERKMIKKQSKAFHTLKNREREVGEISDVPTPYLLVKNGGLMCGVERQDLVNVFDKYGKLVDLVMFPGKSYSYVLFSDTTSAEEAMTNLNGQKLYFNQTVCRTFYLAYLLKRPCTELCLSDKSYPAGMILIEDFISEHLELELLQCFSSCKEAANSKEIDVPAEQQLKHRYVKHFGYEFIYGSNNVDKDKPLPNGIPSECLPVMKKLVSLDCVKHEPDQLTINEYQPGQGIPPHVDTHSAFEDGIISLSLGAKVAMDFRHPDGRHVSVLLPRQSVLIMTEECRYAWTHGITPRKYDVVNEDDVTSNENNSNAGGSHSSNAVTLLPREVRLSLTFRKIRRTPCDCKYPANCDSQNYGHQLNKDKGDLDNDDRSGMNCNSLPQSEEDAMDLEKEHVHNVYENIAEHFSGTRHSPWPKIAEFLKEQAPGSIVADVGCGNGKYLGINDQLLMFGSDRSQNLAVICRERGYHVIVCDILSLPYRSNSFDVCICIAVIHHLSTAARRLAAIKELTRIIRRGGRILISVWALEQNLKNREKLDHSGKSTLTDNKICSTAEEVEKQRLEQSRGSAIASEGINSNVETTAGGAAKSVINDSVLSKQDLCSKASNRVDDFGYQNNVHLDKNPVSHHNEDTHTLNTSKLSSTSSHETDASRPGDASEILPPSKISGLPNCSSTAIETSSLGQGIHPKMEAISSIRECTSSSATSRDSSSKLKVNASRDVFEQQDLLIPWHYRGKKSLDKPIVEKDELELNSAGEEKVPKVFQRFYHVFKEHELADECRKLGNVSIVRSYYDKGNWCVELEKVRDN